MYQFNSLNRVILYFVLSLGILSGQDRVEADFNIAVDFARFSIDGGVYLDVYLMVPQSVFTFQSGAEGLEASVIFQAALVQGDSVPYPPDRWQRIYRAPDRASIANLSWAPDISKFYVEAGAYTLQLDVIDVNSGKRQTIRKPVSLEAFDPEVLTISDILIASNIVKAAKEIEFTKYGYDVVPNAQRTFTVNAPMMYYFLEAYGLSGSGTYTIQPQILSLNEDVVQDFPVKTKKMPGNSVVEWGGVNTAGLGSGIYKLAVTVSDESSSRTVTQKRTFYILRSTEKPGEVSASEKDDYSGITASEVEDIFKVVSIVMDKTEKRLFKRSDDVGKRNILTAFWERKDPTPDTEINEFKQEFYQRVQMANRQFGTETDAGWATDRGRILIKYGKPNNIERQQSSLAQKPYISWQYYEIEGGVQFIFVDRSGYGNFQLVHSDARDEVQDPEWQRFLE